MNKKVLRTAIVAAWAMLLFSFIFKLCGSKAFEIVAVNERFVTICDWLDNDGEIAKYALMFVMYYVSTIFIILASSLKIKLSGKEFILTTILLVAVWIVKLFYPKIGFVVESLELIIVPSILSRKIWTGIAGYGINLLFQIISVFVRGAGMKIFTNNTILALILSIDYYIMIALFYMYIIVINNKKGEK